jgi:hypothetical protein
MKKKRKELKMKNEKTMKKGKRRDGNNTSELIISQ